MQTYENKGAEVFSNGSAGHINGAELTRMKEITFEKNPSEPMVNTHSHTGILYFHIWVTDSSSLTAVCVVGGHSEAER